jgi:hypothetical protein
VLVHFALFRGTPHGQALEGSGKAGQFVTGKMGDVEHCVCIQEVTGQVAVLKMMADTWDRNLIMALEAIGNEHRSTQAQRIKAMHCRQQGMRDSLLPLARIQRIGISEKGVRSCFAQDVDQWHKPLGLDKGRAPVLAKVHFQGHQIS